jgi:glucosamine--fructose-6-phosphate aminotransferase (isomerizing)
MRGQAGVHTITEIRSQADSWEGVFYRIDKGEKAFHALFEATEEVLFTGCGSACNVAYAVAPFFQKLSGRTCRALHASDLMINGDLFLNERRNTAVVAYSRSGDTTETVQAMSRAKRAGTGTLAVVCFPKSMMAREADASLVLEEAMEKSVTTTRSLTAMVLSGAYLGAVSFGDEEMRKKLKMLPPLARERMELFHDLGKSIGSDREIRKFAFLGQGSYYGLAREAQLKVKEMVLLPSDSYVSLDFQHGPMSNVDSNMLVTILVSDGGRRYDLELARNMKALGGKVLVICDRGGKEFDEYTDYLLELDTGLGDGIRNILYMPVLQFMAYYRSLAEGQDPDNPKNLKYFVSLDE